MPMTRYASGCRIWCHALRLACLLSVWWCVPQAYAWHLPGRTSPTYSLLRSECEPMPYQMPTSHAEQSLRCAGQRVFAVSAPTASTPQGAALEWKSVHDTVKLRPIAGASISIASFGTFDGDVSVVNVPLVGTTLLASTGGAVNFNSSIGLGIGGFYLHAGVRVPLYFKYPHFWSLDAVFGTAYNLDFRFRSDGFWGGGPALNLELGLVRVGFLVALGLATNYCGESFLCDPGFGGYVALGVALIKSTTGLPQYK
jgi:hypothetical protein